MKIGVVYTSTTPELIQMVDASFAEEFDSQDVEILRYQNPDILQEVRNHGGVTPKAARDLADLYEQAAHDGADVLLNICSSVGDVARAAQPLYALTGVPLVRVDEDMACQAVKNGGRIGVVATLPTTMEPTKRLLKDCAARMGTEIVLVDVLIEGIFGASQEAFKQKLIEAGSAVKNEVDLLVFAQGSMAYAEEAVSETLHMPVYSSVRSGVKAVRAVTEAMTKQVGTAN